MTRFESGNSNRQTRIEQSLRQHFQPEHLEVRNESHQHNVPVDAETHFSVLIVASFFEGQSRVERQQAVNQALEGEFRMGLHALTQRVLTPEEWQAGRAEGFKAPACAHKKT